MFKRYFYFFLTNILVVATCMTVANLVMSFLGISFGSQGGLFIFCFIWGMVGSFISLRLSRWLVKKSMNLRELQDASLLQKIQTLSRNAGLKVVPEAYIFDQTAPNAFATGHNRDNSLVAISTGLLQNMNEDEVEAVIAHEISHIANGDMVTMALVQGIVNSFVMFISYLVSNLIMNAFRSNDDSGHSIGDFFLYHIIHNIVYVLLAILASPIVMFVSRQREYRADAGSAKLVGRHKMVAALEALKRNYDPEMKVADDNVEVLGITSKESWMTLFASHPPLDKRIAALMRGI